MSKLKEVVNPRFATAIFCDDIRYELGNKVTLVGLYNKDLFVQEFPAHLSRLAVSLTVDTPIEEPFETLGVIVEKGNEVVLEIPTQSVDAYVQRPKSGRVNGQDEFTRATLGMQFFLPPLPILESCTVRVKVILDQQIITAGKIFISAIETHPSTTH